MTDPEMQKEMDNLAREFMADRLQKKVNAVLDKAGLNSSAAEGAQSNHDASTQGVHGKDTPAPAKNVESQGEDNGYSYGMGQ